MDLTFAVTFVKWVWPVLILTARTQTVDKVVGLKLGADDYVTKPFATMELFARMEVLLRRVPIRTGQGVLEVPPVRLDMRRIEVSREGKPIYLTVREFQLLPYLMERAGKRRPRKRASSFGFGDMTVVFSLVL